MKRRKFKCRRCGQVFVAEILEEGEAEARRIRPAPVRCPQCSSTDLNMM